MISSFRIHYYAEKDDNIYLLLPFARKAYLEECQLSISISIAAS